MAREHADWKRLLEGRALPVALVDLEAFDRNLAQMTALARATGKHLRIATKSLRVPELIRRALQIGAPVRGLMCYSAREASFLAEQFPPELTGDLLVAYPTLQDADLRALRILHECERQPSLIIDGEKGLRALGQAMAGVARPFRFVIEVDVSLRPFGGVAHLGARRSPVRTPAQLAALLQASRGYPHLKPVGMMGYESQVAGLGDRNPFKRGLNPAFSLVRRLSIPRIATLRQQLAETFEREAGTLEIFNGGGSGSANFTAREPAITELAIGSALLASHLFDYYSNIRFEPAAYFALQTVRRSDPGFVTCQGGGYIASGEPGWDRVPVPVSPPGARLVGSEGAGEVQTPLRLRSGTSIEVGDPVVFRHAKAGELAERFNEYLLVSGDRIVGRAPTYRGLGQSYF